MYNSDGFYNFLNNILSNSLTIPSISLNGFIKMFLSCENLVCCYAGTIPNRIVLWFLFQRGRDTVKSVRQRHRDTNRINSTNRRYDTRFFVSTVINFNL